MAIELDHSRASGRLRTVRDLAIRAGLYPIVRGLYRTLHPHHRRERRWNRHFYRQIIRPDDLCFDVGANVGQTIEALLEASARVVALEPNPQCGQVLSYQFAGNPRVRIIPKGVAAEPGHADLFFHGTESTASMRRDWPFENDRTVRVPVVTLDQLIEEFGRPAFLKVDVEGFELEVFKGLSQAVATIYFECHSHEQALAEQILEHLASVGRIAGINAVSGDNSTWLLRRWVAHEDFLAELPRLPRQANVVVKMECSSSGR